MVLFLVFLLLCSHSSGDSAPFEESVREDLKNWKENIFELLSHKQKICKLNNLFQSHKKEIPRNEFENTFIMAEEREDQEEIAIYDTASQKQAVWNWPKSIEEVSLFRDKYSEIIFIDYDNVTFAYTHILKNTDYHTCTITKLQNISNFLVPTCTYSNRQIITIAHDTDQSNPPWYKYARIAFQDQRIAQLHRDSRKPSDPKFLTLPFFRNKIMNDGEYAKSWMTVVVYFPPFQKNCMSTTLNPTYQEGYTSTAPISWTICQTKRPQEEHLLASLDLETHGSGIVQLGQSLS